ncbi:PfaD family polyunsaturated fatty acid/polyketide biosynthesis protein [Mycobacterium sp.]|uniref:PfaD family polyunsaturated fatty acid/polyketide biosynthesis protein n=1 Tax=Mycobacterium sp. TaxID=1785 RepID=UPI003BAC2F91
MSTLRLSAERLGSRAFRSAHKTRYAYASGAMYQGIASPALVARMAAAGYLAYLGNGGLPIEQVERDLCEVKSLVPRGCVYGVNLLSQFDDPAAEDAIVELILRHGVTRVEASAFMQVTPALAAYRLSGLQPGTGGSIRCEHLVLGKTSRLEVASQFLSPVDPALVGQLRCEGRITAQQAEWSSRVAVADDICVEADSGGHTDQGVLGVILPAFLSARAKAARDFPPAGEVRLGAGGGLGTPEAVAAAFVLGADFVMTGSVNQCTVEARTHEKVKETLQQAGPADTAICPAGDMLELGAKMQVLRRGLLFPARAEKLYEFYRQYQDWFAIPDDARSRIENTYFRRPIVEVLDELQSRTTAVEWMRVQKKPRETLAMICRWYFHHTTQWALRGEPGREADYQIHCGPALGAFNQIVQGTAMEDWRNRHVDHIAEFLMTGAAEVLSRRFEEMTR